MERRNKLDFVTQYNLHDVMNNENFVNKYHQMHKICNNCFSSERHNPLSGEKKVSMIAPKLLQLVKLSEMSNITNLINK